MNEGKEDPTTNLLELAKASWNPTLLVPCRPDLIATRPLMVLMQRSDEFNPLSATIDDLRGLAEEQLAQAASLGQFIEAHEGVAVLFLAEFHYDFPDFAGLMLGDEGEQRVAPDIREAQALATASPTEHENEDDEQEPAQNMYLFTIIVLPEEADQEIDLESIEEAIPDFTGKAFWFDPSDELVKFQSWCDGGTDYESGYLQASRNEDDVEDYSHDAAPGRALFAKILTRTK